MLENQNIQIFVDVTWTEINEVQMSDFVLADRVRHKGSMSPNGKHQRMNSACYISRPEKNFSGIDDHWREISKRLYGNESLFKATKEDGVRCIVTIETVSAPEFPISRIPLDLVEFAASVKAAIDLDVYSS